jgi:pyruvate/2-oxoglutarate dehydrogenase complex dihydrolipoamide acyltransferase (E2) component
VTAPPLRFTGIRGMIARRMQDSLATTAQLSFFADADVRALNAARDAWKAAGHKIGVEDFVMGWTPPDGIFVPR